MKMMDNVITEESQEEFQQPIKVVSPEILLCVFLQQFYILSLRTMRAMCLSTPIHHHPPFPPFLPPPLTPTRPFSSFLPQKKREKEPEGAHLKSYQWSDLQNLKYYHFLLRLKQEELLNPENGRIGKINIRMSRWVGTRTPVQCRSHNQKMLKRHSSFHGIIDYFAQYFSKKSTNSTQTELESTSDQPRLQIQRMLFPQQKSISCDFLQPNEGWDFESSPPYSKRIHFNYF